MKTVQIIIVAFLGLLWASCGNSNLKDVSDEPEFKGMSNNIFFTNQPMYYYKYNNEGGVITDHFLSLQHDDSNGTKIQDIPKGSHIKVSKVYKLALKDGDTLIWITGEVFPSPNVSLPYETALIESESFFEQRN
ncbi:hypothetical protein [Galbibacter sp.]|uniref:hypothetical protein n=1 Tax=Galbibacter sp. TaxID=2918471 RepID=UPI003A8D7C8F